MIETLDLSNPERPTGKKGPLAILDYVWDWSEYLAHLGDSISTYDVYGSTGVVVTNKLHANGLVSASIGGGILGKTAAITCKIVTVDGRTDYRTIYLDIIKR